MTAADHANTVRMYLPNEATRARAALDALQAQAVTGSALARMRDRAEAAEAEARKWFGIYEEELTRADAAEARVTELERQIELRDMKLDLGDKELTEFKWQAVDSPLSIGFIEQRKQ